MRYGVLGPLTLYGPGGGVRELPAAKERLVAAALIARANSVVSVDALVDAVWGDDAPRTAAKTLQTYISAVRRAVGADQIVTRPPGYLLRAEPADIDSLLFVSMADRGRSLLARGEVAEASATLGAALELWRGDAFEEFADRPFFVAEATQLGDLRLSVTEASNDARLMEGEHQQLVAALEALVSGHPLRERLWAQLMVAQYRSGRQADALRSFQRARRVLAEQLGIDPGAELRELEQAILRQDPSLDLAPARRAVPGFVPPVTRYAVLDDSFIAYQTLGEGPEDLLYVPDWWSHVEAIWEHPVPREFLRRLAQERRLLLFDSRGTGQSDPIDRNAVFTLEDWAADARTVLDTIGSRRVVVFSASAGTFMSLLLAAQEPHRVRALVIVNGTVSMSDTAPGRAGFDAALHLMKSRWGAGPGFAEVLPHLDEDADFAEWFSRFQRLAVSPGQIEGRLRMIWDARLEDVARMISVPTLVMHRRGNAVIGVELGRDLAELIPGAAFVELDGDDHFWAGGDTAAIVSSLEAFLAGTRRAPAPDRILATMLVTRFTDRTGTGARFGEVVARQVERHQGQLLRHDEGQVVAVFDGPARGIACGWALGDVARQHGAGAATGVHTGEIDRHEPAAAGPTRTLAEHAAAIAGAGQIVVTRTIVDLTAGSGHSYSQISREVVPGVGGSWAFFLAPS